MFGKLPNLSVLAVELLKWKKLSYLSVLPYLSWVSLGAFHDLSALPLLNCVIIRKLPDLSLLPLQLCDKLSKHSVIPMSQFSSVTQLCPTLCNPMDGSMPGPCPWPTPGACSNSCPLSWQHHPTISSSVILFSSHLQSLPASGSFQMSQFFASGGQSVGVSASASVDPMNIQDWFL